LFVEDSFVEKKHLGFLKGEKLANSFGRVKGERREAGNLFLHRNSLHL
jgi:hypothetical protein